MSGNSGAGNSDEAFYCRVEVFCDGSYWGGKLGCLRLYNETGVWFLEQHSGLDDGWLGREGCIEQIDIVLGRKAEVEAMELGWIDASRVEVARVVEKLVLLCPRRSPVIGRTV